MIDGFYRKDHKVKTAKFAKTYLCGLFELFMTLYARFFYH
jgi:hypothetical protein